MEVGQLASILSLNDEEDALIWQFSCNGVYSSQSLYKVINFWGIKNGSPFSFVVYQGPLGVHLFLWLLFKSSDVN